MSIVILLLAVASASPRSAEVEEAVARVRAIVNQPVTALPRDPSESVAVFSPGWFHEGARKPDFRHVDVRRTQELPYDKWEFVTSDINPDVMFRGRDLEFNSMTKYFYTDRTVPKKRLTEEEMLEINRLYRIIAGPAPQASAPESLPPDAVAPSSILTTSKAQLGFLSVALLLTVVLLLRRRSAAGGR